MIVVHGKKAKTSSALKKFKRKSENWCCENSMSSSKRKKNMRSLCLAITTVEE